MLGAIRHIIAAGWNETSFLGGEKGAAATAYVAIRG
jgi:hypothetical protein